MKKTIISLLTVIGCSVLPFVSCTKKQVAEVDNETRSVVDFAVTHHDFISLMAEVQHRLANTPGTGTKLKSSGNYCEAFTLVSGDTAWGSVGHVNPTFTAQIGTSTCVSGFADDQSRRGKITVYLSDLLQTTGARLIIKVSDYQTDLVKEAGAAKPRTASCDSIVLTTVSANSTLSTCSARLINGVYSPTASKMNFDLTVQFYHLGTNNTASYCSHYGSVSGTNQSGRKYSVQIPSSTPLVKRRTCNSFDEGRCELTPEGFNTRLIDFGNGSCDENATFSINGNIIAFKLK